MNTPRSSTRRILTGSIAAACAVALIGSTAAHAVTYYWDNNGTTAGFGTAGGTWAAPTVGSATQGWSTDTTGVAATGASITTGTADGENFGTGTAGQGLATGTITVSGAVSAGNMTFGSQSGVITLSGGTINMGNSQIIVNNASDTIASVLGGTNPLTKAGTGILILTGANTRTGALTITAGTLQIGNGGATGSLTGTASITNNAALVYNLSSALSATYVTSGTGTLTKQGAGTLTLSGASTYTGTTTVSAGTLNLTGARTVAAGAITVGVASGGAAVLGISNGTFSMGSFTVGTTGGAGTVNQTGGSITTGGNQLLLGNGAGTGTYNLSAGTLNTVASSLGVTVGVNTGTTGNFNLSGSGILNMAATSTLQITRSDSNGAASGVTGTFTQTGGTATVGILQMGGSSTTPSNNANQIATLNLTGGTFSAVTFNQLSGGTGSTSAITIGGTAQVTLPKFSGTRTGTATILFDSSVGGYLRPTATDATYMAAGTYTSAKLTANGAKFDTNSFNITIGQILQDNTTGGTLTKLGAGTLTLTGANTYTGGTVVSAGTLLLSGAVNLPATGALQVNTGATFSLADGTASATTTAASLNLANRSSLTFDWVAGATDTLTSTAAATATGTVGININALSSPTGSGLTLISSPAGGLTSGGANYLLANNTDYIATLAQSDTFVTIGSYSTATALTNAYWLGGQLTGALGAMALSNGTTSNWASDASGTSAGGLVPGSTANVFFSTTTGATQQANVVLGANMTLNSVTFNDTTPVTIGADGFSLTLNSTGTGAASAISANQNATINAGVILGAAQTWTVASATTLSVGGAVSGAFGLTKDGPGTLTLTGVNTYTGVTTISGGTLQLGDGTTGKDGTIANSPSLVNNAALVYNRFGTSSYGGVISGTGTVTKTGAGTQTLAGANTYTGLTTISTGILKLGNIAALGAGTGAADGTTISSGATLDLGGVTNGANAERITVSGTGVGGSGAIISSAQIASPFFGVRYLTLAGDTALGFANRWDVGSSTAANNGFVGGGFNLTFLGTAAAAQASLNFLGETDLGDITVNLGNVAATNILFLQGDTTLGQTAKTVTITGGSTLEVFTSATLTTYDKKFALDNGIIKIDKAGAMSLPGTISLTNANTVNANGATVAITASNVISGTGTLTKTGNGTLTFSGSDSNTYAGLTTVAKTGTTGSLILAKTGGAIAIAGNLTIGDGTATPGSVALGENNQINPASTVTFTGINAGWGYFMLQGRSQTIGNVVETTPGFGVIETREGSGTFGTSTITFNVAPGTQTYQGYFRDINSGTDVTNSLALVKTGAGILQFGAASNGAGSAGTGATSHNYTGGTTIANGTLQLTASGTAGALSIVGTNGVRIDGGATFAGTLDLNGVNASMTGLNGVTGTVLGQVVNNLTGTVTLTIGSNNTSGSFAGLIANNNNAGSGVLAITKTGTGTQTLSGNNTYTGTTSVNGGVLVAALGAGGTNILPAGSALTLGGGTLQLTGTGTQTVNGLTTAAGTTSYILLGANETLTLGGLTSAGAGSLLNFNTSAGGANATTTTIGTSLIVLTGQTPGNAINTGFTVTDTGGFGLATVNGSDQVVRSTVTNTTLLPASGAVSTINYLIDNNAGGSAAPGSSSLVVTASQATNSITVDTTAAVGVLTLDSGVVLSNNTWNFGGVGSNTFNITGSAGGAGLNSVASGNTITINNFNAGLVTFTSPILANGVNPVVLNGTGTTVFAGTNTYSGSTTINGGTLQLGDGTTGNDGTISSSTGIINNGTLVYNRFGSLSSSVPISGTGVVIKSGGGTQILTGANTYTGGTTINANSGTLQATITLTASGLGTGPVSVGANSTLVLDNTNLVNSTPGINNIFTGSGLLRLQFAANTQARNTNMPNVTGFAGTIQLSTPGLTGDKFAVSNLGTILGSLIIDSGTSINASGSTIFTGGITLNGTGNTEGRGAIRLQGTLGGNINLASSSTINLDNAAAVLTGNISSGAAGTQILTLGATGSTGGTLSGIIGGGTGTLDVTTAVGGTYILTNVNTYTGATTIAAGTSLQLGNGTTGNDGTIASTSGILDNGTLIYNRFGTLSSSVPISGTGAVTKTGAGTQTLAGTNTYSGNTTVSAGQLNITGSYTPVVTTGSRFLVNGGSMTVNTAGTATFYADGFATAGEIGVGATTGTLTLQAGTLNVLTKTGGSFGSINLGVGAATSNGTLIVNGGILNVEGRILMAANVAGAQATLTISGGQVNLGKVGSYINGASDPGSGVLWFGAFNSTVNLNGGTLALFGMRTTTASGTQGSFNFNGGTLQAVATNTTDFFKLNTGMPAVVKSGGAIIDTNTFDALIPTALTHDSTLGATPDGGLTKLNTGTLTLTGLNSFTGNITVSNGILAGAVAGSGGNSAFGSVVSTRTINVNTGGTLRFDVGNVFNNNFASASTSLPALNVVGGTVTNGASATNNALGNVTLAGGTLTATVGSASGYGSWNLNGTVTSTGTSLISSTASVPITLSAAAGTNTTFDVQSGTLTVSAALGQVTATGDERISSLTKTGAGTMVLSGTNTYTGGTTVNAGTLNVNSALATGSTVNANATTNFGVSQTLGALNIGAGAVATLTATPPFAPLAGEALSGPSSAVVPEPGSIGLLLVGSLGLLARRRRRA